MFDWWSKKGSRVFWFVSSEKDGRPGLIKPDGTEVWPSLKDYIFNENDSIQKRNAYLRENLLLEEYGIWDITAFSASMSAVLCFKANDGYAYLFATLSHADENVFPFISKEDIDICKDNAEAFYSDPNLQAGWSSLILYPVSLRINKDGSLEPVYIGDIADNEQYLSFDEYEDWTAPRLDEIDPDDIYGDNDPTNKA